MGEESGVVTGAASGPLAGRAGIDDGRRRALLAGGSVLGAIAMSSCCIVPLALFSLGVTGAWIGNLAALYPYKWLFFLATAAFLGGGFYTVYHKPATRDCAPGSYCARPVASRINRIVLWAATGLALAALAFPYVAPALLDT